MTTFQDLQAEHEALLKRHETPADPAQFWADVQHFIERVRIDAEDISAPRERDQLRAILRFWASYVYDKTGSYPDTTMRPAMHTDVSQSAKPASAIPPLKPPAPPPQRAPLGWAIAALALIAIVVAAIAYGRSIQPMTAAPEATEFAPVSTPGSSVTVDITVQPPVARRLEIQGSVLTAGPSPFDPNVWTARLQLTATGGNGTYIFWVNGVRLPDISDDQFTVEGTGCEPQKPVTGVTSGGQATSLELVIQSPLAGCR
jgi:hypothetical protein